MPMAAGGSLSTRARSARWSCDGYAISGELYYNKETQFFAGALPRGAPAGPGHSHRGTATGLALSTEPSTVNARHHVLQYHERTMSVRR